MLSFPPSVACGLCSGLCKRAVLVSCCNAIACRACAVKAVTQSHKCWNKKCAKVLTGSDIINNDPLRAEIDSLSDGSILDCGLCKEMCKRGIKLDCCGTRACRACAIKEITTSRTCWSCYTLELTSENLVNDDQLRTAVDQFKNHKILLPDLRKQLTKKVGELAVTTDDAQATTSKVKSTPEKLKGKADPVTKKSTVEKKQVKKIIPKQKEKPATIQKQNVPNKKTTSSVSEMKISPKIETGKKENGEETSFFRRPLPELKPFVEPRRGPAPPVAPVGQAKAVKRQWAPQFARPVVDKTLRSKRMALDQMKQKILGPGSGQAFGIGPNAGGLGQMGGGGGIRRFGGGELGFRGMGPSIGRGFGAEGVNRGGMGMSGRGKAGGGRWYN